MGNNDKIVADEGLRFFGKVVASVSHEIKNVMAIVNEKAGLLKDYTMMAEKGIQLQPEKIVALADDLKLQIKRGDDIIKNMNKFSHSVDEEIQVVDLKGLTELIVFLSMRSASQKGVTLHHEAEQSITIRTRPFILENLIWDLLRLAMEKKGEEKQITLRLKVLANGGRLGFSIGEEIEEESILNSASDGIRPALEKIGAALEIDKPVKEMALILPMDVCAV